MCLYAVTLKASFHSVWLKNCKKLQTRDVLLTIWHQIMAKYPNHSEELIRQSNSQIVIIPFNLAILQNLNLIQPLSVVNISNGLIMVLKFVLRPYPDHTLFRIRWTKEVCCSVCLNLCTKSRWSRVRSSRVIRSFGCTVRRSWI